jgi:hypothetical protein
MAGELMYPKECVAIVLEAEERGARMGAVFSNSKLYLLYNENCKMQQMSWFILRSSYRGGGGG